MLVERYNPEWRVWFVRLQALLYRNLAGTYDAIEHVGSTSVPGMTAKPVIDVDVVHREGLFDEVKLRLESMGYSHKGDQGIASREVFKQEEPGLNAILPRHHLYVCPPDSPELRRHLAFRDYLLAHPEEAGRLSEHKWEVASRLGDDVDAYQAAKAPRVEQVLQQALREARG